MNEENWKPVAGYEDSYEVSDHGRVKCLYREKEFMARWGMAKMRFPAKIMKISTTTKGYLYVGLSKDARPKKHLIHRLVMAAFVGESDMEVNHKDGNKSNNHISNLEYCTSSENNRHRSRVLGKVIGSSNTAAVLTEKDIPIIRADPRKLKDIAADYGVTLQAIWAVKKRKNWTHIPEQPSTQEGGSMKCTCGEPLTPRVMHRVDAPCYVISECAHGACEQQEKTV